MSNTTSFTPDFLSSNDLDFHPSGPTILQISGDSVALPDESYVRDADMSRDGMDLVLEGPHGTVVVEGYFAAVPTPMLSAPDGTGLTPKLVDSFLQEPLQYADASGGTASDESPVGAVHELTGEATVTRLDGTVEIIQIGTPIYQGDVIETSGDGAVNIMFIDETTFAVSEDARLAIDEYVFDPATQSGSTNFSVLKGVFVFTSGMIGREDPDDVQIETPVGSIGIRGTIIAGNVDSGEITVVEGAIVLRDFSGNEMTLATQFETAKFNTGGGNIEYMGQMAANDVSARFSSVSPVSGNLFSSINDAAKESGESKSQNSGNQGESGQDSGQQNNSGSEDNTDQGTQDGAQDSQGEQGDSAPQGTEGTGNQQGATQNGTQQQTTSTADTGNLMGNNSLDGTATGVKGTSAPAPSTGSGATATNTGTASSGTGTSGTATSAPSGSTATKTGTVSGSTNTTNTSISDQPPPPPPQTTQSGTSSGTTTGGATGTGTTSGGTTSVPPVITAGTLSINENSAMGTNVSGSVTASGTGIVFSEVLGGAGASIFDIAANGTITVQNSSALDFETNATINYVIRATDSAGRSTDQTITIHLNNLNETAPVIHDAQAFSVSEDAADNTTLGVVTFSDTETAGTNVFSIVTSDAPTGMFAIDATTGQIRLADNAGLDFEGGTALYTLTVQISDGTHVVTEEVSITVANVDEVPTITGGQMFTIDENAANTTVVGTVLANDPENVTLSYGIAGGNYDGIFTINADTGVLSISDLTYLDYEYMSTHTLTIEVSDGVHTVTQDVVINLNDLNDNAALIDIGQSFSVDEDAVNGTVIGDVAFSDIDILGLLNFSIVGGNEDGIFAIDSNTGDIRIFDNTNLDFETTQTYTLTISLADGINLPVQQTITITINDMLEIAVNMSLDSLTATPGTAGYKIYDNLGLGLGAHIAAMGDLNADGFDDLLLGRGGDDMLFVVHGNVPGQLSSAHTKLFDLFDRGMVDGQIENIVSIGDFNGDGRADFLVSMPGYNAGHGVALVMDAQGDVLYRLDGVSPSQGLGDAIQGAGDINGDGYSDIIIRDSMGVTSVVFGGKQIESAISLPQVNGAIVDFTSSADRIFTLQNGRITRLEDSGDVLSTDGSLDISGQMNSVTSIAFDSTANFGVVLGTASSMGRVLVFDHNLNIVNTVQNAALNGAADAAVVGNSVVVIQANGSLGFINNISGSITYQGAIAGTGNSLTILGVVGTNVYVRYDGASGFDSGIRVIDTSQPYGSMTPTALLDTVDVLENAIDVIMSSDGSRIFAMYNNSGQFIIKVIDPSMPVNAEVIYQMTSDMGAVGANIYPFMLNGSQELAFHSDGTDSYLLVHKGDGSILKFNVTGDVPVYEGAFKHDSLSGANPEMLIGPDGTLYVINELRLSSVGNDFDDTTTLSGLNADSEIISAGDFDGDGITDIVFSRPNAGGSIGEVVIRYGDDIVNGSDGSDTVITGIMDNDTDGSSTIPVLNIGDINGDGVSDIAFAAVGANSGKGEIYVMYGGDPGLRGMGLNVSSVSAAQGFRISTGTHALMFVGGNGIGDFNGDGIDDIAIALKDPDAGSQDVQIFVVYGGQDIVNDGLITYEELVHSDNSYHITYTIPTNNGATDMNDFEFNIERAGDVNGDGLADFMVGMPNSDSDADSDSDGTVYVVYGNNDETADVVNGGTVSANGQNLMGSESNDVLDTLGFTDIAVSTGAGNDRVIISSSDSFSRIDGGAGDDIVSFNSALLDLSNVNALQMQRIERLEMSDSVNSQTLRLSVNSLQYLLQNSDTGELTITGDANDILQIDISTSSGGGSVANIESSLEEIFGTDVVHRTDAGMQVFEIGGYTLNIEDVLINNTVIADVV